MKCRQHNVEENLIWNDTNLTKICISADYSRFAGYRYVAREVQGTYHFRMEFHSLQQYPPCA